MKAVARLPSCLRMGLLSVTDDPPHGRGAAAFWSTGCLGGRGGLSGAHAHADDASPVAGGEGPGGRLASPCMRARRARVEDVHELASAMPHVTVEHGVGGNPVYQVGRKSFVFF